MFYCLCIRVIKRNEEYQSPARESRITDTKKRCTRARERNKWARNLKMGMIKFKKTCTEEINRSTPSHISKVYLFIAWRIHCAGIIELALGYQGESEMDS